MPDTLTNAVGQNSGSLPDRLSALASTPDLVQQLVDVQSQQNKLKMQSNQLQTQQQGVLGQDPQRSLQGILAMLGSGALTAAGQPGAGAGLLEGFMQGAQNNQTRQAQMLALKQQGVDAEQKQVTDMLDSQRQKLVQLLQARPEMFIDPETGKPTTDPRLIGYAATGFMVPIDPSVNYTLTKQTNQQKAMVDTGVTLMMSGDTPEKRRQGMLIYNKALDLDLDEGFVSALLESPEDRQWELVLNNPSIDSIAAVNAWGYAKRENLSLSDPRVAGMLRPTLRGEGGVDTIPKLQISLLRQLNTTAAALGVEVGSMPMAEMIDMVFADQPGDAQVLKDWLADTGDDGVDNESRARIMVSTGALFTDMYMMNPESSFFKRQGINSPEQLWDMVGTLVDSGIGYMQRADADQLHGQQGIDMRKLVTAYAGDPNMTMETAFLSAQKTFNEVHKAGFVGDKFDVAKYNAALEAALEQIGNAGN